MSFKYSIEKITFDDCGGYAYILVDKDDFIRNWEFPCRYCSGCNGNGGNNKK